MLVLSKLCWMNRWAISEQQENELGSVGSHTGNKGESTPRINPQSVISPQFLNYGIE